MNPTQRKLFEDHLEARFFLYVNYFRGGIGSTPAPDPQDRALAQIVSEEVLDQVPLPEGMGSERLVECLRRAVETGAYWGMKMDLGDAQVDDAWWDFKHRRPMKGVSKNALERKLNQWSLDVLAKTAELHESETKMAMSWAAKDLFSYNMPERIVPATSPDPLPELHEDICIRIIEAGILFGLANVSTLVDGGADEGSDEGLEPSEDEGSGEEPTYPIHVPAPEGWAQEPSKARTS